MAGLQGRVGEAQSQRHGLLSTQLVSNARAGVLLLDNYRHTHGLSSPVCRQGYVAAVAYDDVGLVFFNGRLGAVDSLTQTARQTQEISGGLTRQGHFGDIAQLKTGGGH